MNRTRGYLTGLTSVVLLGVLLVLCIPGVAFAGGSVHLSRSNPPVFTSGTGTLTATGEIYGIGATDVLIALRAVGNVGAAESIPVSEIKNGKTSFSLTTEPSGNTSWTSATISVRDESGALLLSQTFSLQ